jgi:molybdenum cofactor cytidylyltransferase
MRTVAAVVLAAGSSRRFGKANKLLAEVADHPLITHAVSAFAASRVSEVIVVTGPDPQDIQAALAGYAVRYAHNPDHLSGMGGSVAAGVAAIPTDSDGVLICPGDMPGISSRFIDSLIDAFEASGGERIIRPELPDGRPAHPVLWPRRLFPALRQLSGPQGGKQILDALAADVVPLRTESTDTALDIDTMDDLEALRSRLREPHGS